MKNILYGTSILLSGIICVLISWMGQMRILDIIGIILGIIGLSFSTIGFIKKSD